MELTLLPLQNDDVLRVRSHGPLSQRDPNDSLQALLGPHCFTHKVFLTLDDSQSIDTSGICWLVKTSTHFTQAGGKLVLLAVPPVLLDVLTFLNLTPLLHIAANEQAACEMIQGKNNSTHAPERPLEPSVRFPR